MPVPARFRGIADRNRKHCPKRATHLVDISRFCRLLVDAWVDVDFMRDVGTCVDSLVRRNGDHFTDVAHTTVDPLRERHLLLIVFGVVRAMVASTGILHPIRIREIGIKRVEGIIRGDQEHSSQMMDGIAESFSEVSLLVCGHAA